MNNKKKYSICIGHYSRPKDISGVTTWLKKFIVTLSCKDCIDLHVLLMEYGTDNHNSAIKHVLIENKIKFTSVKHTKYTIDNVRNILRFFEGKSFSMFIPHCIEAMYFASIQLHKQGLPIVYTMHSDDPVYWANAKILNQYSNPIAVSVSQYIARQYENMFNKVSHVIPYGINLSATLPNNINTSRSNKIIYLGRIVEEQKRISLVYETMLAICRLNHLVECALVGAGPQENWLNEQLANDDANGRITYLGRVKPDQVGGLLSKYGIQLLMSDYEGLPVSMLECMSFGIIPATRALQSGICELVEDGVSGIILPDNPQLAAGKLNETLASKTLLEIISAKCKIVAEEYSEEKNLKRWLSTITRHALDKPLKIIPIDTIFIPKFDNILTGRYKTKPSFLKKVASYINNYTRKYYLIIFCTAINIYFL